MAWFSVVECSSVTTGVELQQTPAGIQTVYKDQRTHPCYLLVLFCKGRRALGPRVLAKGLCVTVSDLVEHPYLSLTLT